MKVNINILKEYIKKEGLKLIKESDESLKKLESAVFYIDQGLIDMYEKKLEVLKKDEESAVKDEEFSRLKEIKGNQVEVLDKLIKFYGKKVEILSKIRQKIQNDASQVGVEGRGVFNNKNLDEFKNEETSKGTKIKIVGSSKYFVVEKVSENNVYNVLDSNINGIEPGDFLKVLDMKVGGSGQVTVYRKSGDRFDELKIIKYNNVTEIIKNPS